MSTAISWSCSCNADVVARRRSNGSPGSIWADCSSVAQRDMFLVPEYRRAVLYTSKNELNIEDVECYVRRQDSYTWGAGLAPDTWHQ